jgi:ABC-type dipeptide/oligopeptide/nickel transport system permease component
VLVSPVIALGPADVLGVFSAKKQYSFFDYATTTISFFGFSVPIFWFALILPTWSTAGSTRGSVWADERSNLPSCRDHSRG